MNRIETLWLAKMLQRLLEIKDYEGVEAIVKDIVNELENEGITGGRAWVARY